MNIRTLALPTGVLAAALILAGCTATTEMGGMDHSSSPSATSSADAEFNDADVAFAMNMIAHHQQAIEMAELLLDKTGIDERVTQLAQDITAAQGPEIDIMTAWLHSWGESADGSGMNHGGGMMSDADMADLETASGAEASRLFLEQMTEHHQGAIDMAQQELDAGANPDALALAQQIIDAQTAEISTMQDILGSL
jgi:uncharacterized protein (DUF305 family)